MKNLRNLKHIFVIICLSLFIFFGIIQIFSREFSDSINGFFIYRSGGWQDIFHKHTLSPSGDIAIVKIDEKTLNHLQAKSNLKTLTLEKSDYIEVIQKLGKAGVRGIAFDIVFQNKDPDEKLFADIMAGGKNIIIASTTQTGSYENTCTLDEDGMYTTCIGAPRSVYKNIEWGIIDIESIYTRKLFFDIKNTPYKQWKSESGSIDVGKLKIKTLALALALGDTNPQKTALNLKNRTEDTIQSPFFGGPGIYPSVSFMDVLNMSDAEVKMSFGGKFVFIGESGTLIHDSFISPVTGEMMDGVETHAHFLDGILQNKMLEKWEYDFLCMVILTIVTILLYFFMPHLISPIFLLIMTAGILWFTRYMYDANRLLIDCIPLICGALLTFPITFVYRFFIVDREKRHIQNAFGHYIDPHIVTMIDAEQAEVALGGERREVTVFFSDIAGFTSISEKIGTQELFYLMSAYLSEETDILTSEGGTLDKYIGDAVMGFFGAPIYSSDHAIRACRTAIRMRAGLPAFNVSIRERGIDPIDFRVGIATGEAMIGNIGSKEHFNYTALGDTVNLASRLEGTGKEYKVHCIISHGCREQIGDTFALRELDTIAVKGKKEGIRIYELLDFQENITDMTIYMQYETALRLYRNGGYLEAGKIWESQMHIDPPSEVMVQRCLSILKGEITVENGIFHMTHK